MLRLFECLKYRKSEKRDLRYWLNCCAGSGAAQTRQLRSAALVDGTQRNLRTPNAEARPCYPESVLWTKGLQFDSLHATADSSLPLRMTGSGLRMIASGRRRRAIHEFPSPGRAIRESSLRKSKITSRKSAISIAEILRGVHPQRLEAPVFTLPVAGRNPVPSQHAAGTC